MKKFRFNNSEQKNRLNSDEFNIYSKGKTKLQEILGDRNSDPLDTPEQDKSFMTRILDSMGLSQAFDTLKEKLPFLNNDAANRILMLKKASSYAGISTEKFLKKTDSVGDLDAEEVASVEALLVVFLDATLGRDFANHYFNNAMTTSESIATHLRRRNVHSDIDAISFVLSALVNNKLITEAQNKQRLTVFSAFSVALGKPSGLVDPKSLADLARFIASRATSLSEANEDADGEDGILEDVQDLIASWFDEDFEIDTDEVLNQIVSADPLDTPMDSKTIALMKLGMADSSELASTAGEMLK